MTTAEFSYWLLRSFTNYSTSDDDDDDDDAVHKLCSQSSQSADC